MGARLFRSMTWIEEFQVRIPSSTMEGQKVQERIIKLLEELEFPARGIFGVRLALEEALVNAIKHGNGLDPNKQVQVVCQVSSQKVRIVIEDEGNGFRPQDVPDPTEDENLEKPCGRGIMLMRAFLSVVEYNERGNRVVLEKNRNDDGAPLLS
jgi:serine/threonine-protein kinase RsbW